MQHAPGSESPPADAAAATPPHVEFARVVAADAGQMRAVRAELRSHLGQWDLSERVANAVLDVAHELIVNAHRHGAPPVRLTVAMGVDDVRVAVADTSTNPARLLPYRPGVSEHGLGLQLVRQLSAQWGQTMHEATDHEPGGKTVWAIFPRPR